MGRFARNQDEAVLKSREPEMRSGGMKSQADSLDDRQAKGMKYFWIVLVSLVGLSAGWMLGQAWLKPPEVALTESAALADDSIKGTQSPKDDANQAASPAATAQPLEQDTQSLSQDQASQDQASEAKPSGYDRKRSKARRAFVRAPRTPGRGAAMAGPVRMMLKPFKVINPLKLRRLRPW